VRPVIGASRGNRSRRPHVIESTDRPHRGDL